MFLIDTCTFLWFILGDTRISVAAKNSILGGEELYLSVVSNWEYFQKFQLEKPGFNMLPPEEFIQQRESLGIISLPLGENSVKHLVRLPLIHKDPFDRMLICQALEHGLTLITPDEKIRQYPIKTLW